MGSFNSNLRFLELLQTELAKNGFESTAEFRVPGTTFKIDLYVPTIPRAAIEVKRNFSEHAVAALLELLKAIEARNEVFGGRLNTFLIADARLPPLIAEETNKNPFLYTIIADLNSDKSHAEAERVAAEIGRVLSGLRNRQLHMRSRSIERVPDQEEDITPISDVFDLSRVEEEYIAARNLAGAKILQTTETIFASFRHLVSSDRFQLLKYEVEQLHAEYNQRHFTACALRVGRCLEFIIYSLASAWNVRLDEPVLTALDDLQRRLRHINSLVLEYRELDGDSRKNIRRQIVEFGAKFSARLTEMIFEFESMVEAPELTNSPPRNIEAILRDIRKTHKRYEKVRMAIDDILPLVRKVLDLRNNAAHADPSGSQREVEQSNVEEMLCDVQAILFKMSVVGEVISFTDK